MDSHALPDCRPLVGPGNTNHALDGPRRRSCTRQWFVIDMENTSTQLYAGVICWGGSLTATPSDELPSQPTPRRNKKTPGRRRPGVGFFCTFSLCANPRAGALKAPVITTRPVGFATTSYCYSTWRRRGGQARSWENGGKYVRKRSFAFGNGVGQRLSRRDFVGQPRVIAQRLPWALNRRNTFTPKGLRKHGATSLRPPRLPSRSCGSEIICPPATSSI